MLQTSPHMFLWAPVQKRARACGSVFSPDGPAWWIGGTASLGQSSTISS